LASPSVRIDRSPFNRLAKDQGEGIIWGTGTNASVYRILSGYYIFRPLYSLFLCRGDITFNVEPTSGVQYRIPVFGSIRYWPVPNGTKNEEWDGKHADLKITLGIKIYSMTIKCFVAQQKQGICLIPWN